MYPRFDKADGSTDWRCHEGVVSTGNFSWYIDSLSGVSRWSSRCHTRKHVRTHISTRHTPRCRKQRVTRLNAVESRILADLQSWCLCSETSAATSAAKVLPVFNSTERPMAMLRPRAESSLALWEASIKCPTVHGMGHTRIRTRRIHTLKASLITDRTP